MSVYEFVHVILVCMMLIVRELFASSKRFLYKILVVYCSRTNDIVGSYPLTPIMDF